MSAWSQSSQTAALIEGFKQPEGKTQQASHASESAPEKAQTQEASRATKKNGRRAQRKPRARRDVPQDGVMNDAVVDGKYSIDQSTALFNKLYKKAEKASPRGPYFFTDKTGNKKRIAIHFDQELNKRFGIPMPENPPLSMTSTRGNGNKRRKK